MKKLFSLVLISLAICHSAVAADNTKSDGKYYLLVGEPGTLALQSLINNPSDLAINYRKELKSIGADLVSYYFEAGSSRMYATIVFPDSSAATAHLYQRMSTGVMDIVDIIEVIPSDQMVSVLEKSKNFDQMFKSKGNFPK